MMFHNLRPGGNGNVNAVRVALHRQDLDYTSSMFRRVAAFCETMGDNPVDVMMLCKSKLRDRINRHFAKTASTAINLATQKGLRENSSLYTWGCINRTSQSAPYRLSASEDHSGARSILRCISGCVNKYETVNGKRTIARCKLCDNGWAHCQHWVNDCEGLSDWRTANNVVGKLGGCKLYEKLHQATATADVTARNGILTVCSTVIADLEAELRKRYHQVKFSRNTTLGNLKPPFGKNLIGHVVKFTKTSKKGTDAFVSKVHGYSHTSGRFTLVAVSIHNDWGQVLEYKGWRKLNIYHDPSRTSLSLSILDQEANTFVDSELLDKPQPKEQLPSGPRPGGAADDRNPG